MSFTRIGNATFWNCIAVSEPNLLVSSGSELPHLVCKEGPDARGIQGRLWREHKYCKSHGLVVFWSANWSKESYHAAGRGSQGTSRQNNINIVLYLLRKTFSARNVKLNYALGENNSYFFLSWFLYPNLRAILLTDIVRARGIWEVPPGLDWIKL